MNLDLNSYQHYFTEAGRNEIVNTVRAFKAAYADKWLPEFKQQNPDFVEIIDLIANYSAQEAIFKFRELIDSKIDASVESTMQDSNFILQQTAKAAAKAGAYGFLARNHQNVFALHGIIRAEIDEKRF